MVKFSIITVCFNSEKTILETIESVKSQTYTNYEHIIIDGESTDGTLEIISEYMKVSDKVILLSEKDSGIYNAMNKGISLATGDLIVFLNSDDVFENDALEIVANYYNENTDDIIYGNVTWQEKYKSNIYIKDLNLNPNPKVENNEWNSEEMSIEYLDKIKSAHNATFVRSEILKKNLFDEKLKICSDYKFFLNMYIQKRMVRYIPYKITTMKMGGISNTDLILGLKEHILCENQVLGYTNVNEKKNTRRIKRMELIKKISKYILTEKYYIKNRYINRGWKQKVS